MNYGDLVASKVLTPREVSGLSFWAQPLAEALRDDARSHERPMIVAMAGPPCSSKGVFSAFLVHALNQLDCPALHIDMSDFRLSKHARERLTESIHPLFAYPGQVGTHDTAELGRILEALRTNTLAQPLHIPSFDKAYDVRHAFSKWTVVTSLPKVVVVSGWTLGSVAQEGAQLRAPLNAIERDRDPLGHWRKAMNAMIGDHYQPLYGLFDRWVFRKPPSWEAVCSWSATDHERWLKRVVDRGIEPSPVQREGGELRCQLAERVAMGSITRLSGKSDYVLTLDANRRITSFARMRPN